jgi:hypothetical protein
MEFSLHTHFMLPEVTDINCWRWWDCGLEHQVMCGHILTCSYIWFFEAAKGECTIVNTMNVLWNKIEKVCSLQYTDIPKAFLTPHHVGHCCTNVTGGPCCATTMTSVSTVSKQCLPTIGPRVPPLRNNKSWSYGLPTHRKNATDRHGGCVLRLRNT